MSYFEMLFKRLASNRSSGFTLVELLISVALLGIITVPIGASLIMGLQVFDTEVAIDEVFNDQQSAYIDIKESLRADPYRVTIETTAAGVVELGIGEASSKKFYYLKDNDLYRRIDTSEVLICSNVTQFEISDIIKNSQNDILGFVISLTALERNRENTLTSSIALRRY